MAAKKTHTIAVGDVHMDWTALLKILRHYNPKVCLVAGEFGWWPETWAAKTRKGEPRCSLDYLMENNPKGTEIRFIDGNHEDFRQLNANVMWARKEHGIADPFEAVPMRDGLWYQPRGSVYGLADGRKMLCAGGGKSVDEPARTAWLDWFPQEILKRDELPETLPDADVVLSHTVPNRLGVLETLTPVKQVCDWWDEEPDPTCDVLDEVFDACKPSLWIASHLHLARRGEISGCRYAVLDRSDGGQLPWEDFVEVLI